MRPRGKRQSHRRRQFRSPEPAAGMSPSPRVPPTHGRPAIAQGPSVGLRRSMSIFGYTADHPRIARPQPRPSHRRGRFSPPDQTPAHRREVNTYAHWTSRSAHVAPDLLAGMEVQGLCRLARGLLSGEARPLVAPSLVRVLRVGEVLQRLVHPVPPPVRHGDTPAVSMLEAEMCVRPIFPEGRREHPERPRGPGCR